LKIHSLLDDPQAVLISRTPVSDPVTWDDYRRAAWQVMSALEVELEGEKAVLKPNVTSGENFGDPDSGVTTHPAFVQGMIEYLQAHGARTPPIPMGPDARTHSDARTPPILMGSGARRKGSYILEDPRNHDDNEPRHWRGTGYPEVAEATGAALRTPTTYTCVKKAVPHPLAFSTLNVSRLAVSPDTALINVPKLKTHNLGITTLCMKNLMGTVNVFDRHFCGQAWREMPDEVRGNPRPRREWLSRALHEQWQEGLARRLADTAQVVRARLNVVEGVVGREGTGFHQGRNYPLGLAVAGINPVAVDSVASYLIGFDPQELIYLRVAAGAGLGANDLSALRVYEVQDGAIQPCRDLASLRADPPFRVVSNIQGEPEWEPCAS
jgi:uncharacterized protein (DUF362 family)